jgi:hypothetical protein
MFKESSGLYLADLAVFSVRGNWEIPATKPPAFNIARRDKVFMVGLK